MKFTIWPRRGGKTVRTIAWLAEDPENRVVVCASRAVADATFRAALDLMPAAGIARTNFVGPQPDGLRGTRKKVYIDNVDMVLRALYGPVEIVGVTATGEVEERRPTASHIHVNVDGSSVSPAGLIRLWK